MPHTGWAVVQQANIWFFLRGQCFIIYATKYCFDWRGNDQMLWSANYKMEKRRTFNVRMWCIQLNHIFEPLKDCPLNVWLCCDLVMCSVSSHTTSKQQLHIQFQQVTSFPKKIISFHSQCISHSIGHYVSSIFFLCWISELNLFNGTINFSFYELK